MSFLIWLNVTVGYLVSANCSHLRGFRGAGGCVGMDTRWEQIKLGADEIMSKCWREKGRKQQEQKKYRVEGNPSSHWWLEGKIYSFCISVFVKTHTHTHTCMLRDRGPCFCVFLIVLVSLHLCIQGCLRLYCFIGVTEQLSSLNDWNYVINSPLLFPSSSDWDCQETKYHLCTSHSLSLTGGKYVWLTWTLPFLSLQFDTLSFTCSVKLRLCLLFFFLCF